MDGMLASYSVFIDLPYQTAWKRYNHRKFWNVVIHLVTAWMLAGPLLSIPGILFPTFFTICLVFIICVMCLVQDVKLGAIYSVLYVLLAYYYLSVETTLFRAIITILLILGFQVVAGHFVIEQQHPTLSEKQGDALYVVFTVLNVLFLEPFHFSVLILMRANLLPDLEWKSDIQLKKIMENMDGEKSP